MSLGKSWCIILKVNTYRGVGYRIIPVGAIAEETENTITVIANNEWYCVPKTAFFENHDEAFEAIRSYMEEQ